MCMHAHPYEARGHREAIYIYIYMIITYAFRCMYIQTYMHAHRRPRARPSYTYVYICIQLGTYMHIIEEKVLSLRNAYMNTGIIICRLFPYIPYTFHTPP